MQFLEGTISKSVKSDVSIYSPIVSKEREVDFLSCQNIDSRHFSDVHCDKYERSGDTRRKRERPLSSKDNTDRRANR